ncbi:hypothetical protein [Ottowia sp.]|uniref:hypothetical protein n=1 Tax=Ottowia sp. TaxID=1898956 RepID=UPI0025F6E61D|nr:hypothetical protein [Ottowia sp.]MBK6616546.1 hypothetical protein [Ottowia sp.]
MTVKAQAALEHYLSGRLPAGARPLLVVVGPSLEGSKHPSLSASSFIAYYRVISDAKP